MNEHKKKYGWTDKGIVGMLLAPLGFIFLTLGTLFWYYKVGNNPSDPQIFLYVFGGIGGCLFLVGMALLLADLYRRMLQRRAYESGFYVMAKIADVQRQKNININGKNPYKVECHYTDPATGILHVYYSRYLYTNVEGLFLSDQVPVYIDRENDRTGFVDIDAVLPDIQVHR